MSHQSKKTRYYDCPCGRKVPIDGVKVMQHQKPGSSEYCTEGDQAVLTPVMEKANKKAMMEVADANAMVQIKCVYPPCKETVKVKAPPPGVTKGTPQHMATLGGIPMCARHGDILGFMIWFQMNVKMQPQQTKGGLVLPGNKAFEATMKGDAKP